MIFRVFISVYRGEFSYLLVRVIQFFHINRWPTSQSCMYVSSSRSLSSQVLSSSSSSERVMCETDKVISHRTRPKAGASALPVKYHSPKRPWVSKARCQYNRPRGQSQSCPVVEKLPHRRFYLFQNNL